MTESVVFRCQTCGAPLRDVLAGAELGAVDCEYCESENHPQLVSAQRYADRAARMTEAAQEARQLARDMAPRIAAMEAKLHQALLDGEDAVAIRAFEGVIRMHNVSSYHILAAMDVDDPVRIDGLRELDRGIAEAVAQFAESRDAAARDL